MYLLRKDARIQINAISALLGLMHEAQINDHIKKVHADMQVDEGLNRRISAARALYAPKAPA